MFFMLGHHVLQAFFFAAMHEKRATIDQILDSDGAKEGLGGEGGP